MKDMPVQPARSRNRSLPNTKLRSDVAPHKKDFRAFLTESDFGNVKSILVTANTGEVTVKILCEWLSRHSAKIPSNITVPLQILLRSPHVSDKKRADSTQRTVKQIQTLAVNDSRFDVQVRYYASVCPLRATILENSDGTYCGYLSFVDWGPGVNPNQRDAAYEHAFARRKVVENDAMLSVFLSWFRHFWGRHQVHTLIFDFDDTLFLTTAAQIYGWIRAIERSLETKQITEQQLAAEVRISLREGNANDLFTDIFFEEQEEDRILRRLVADELSSEAREFIRRERVSARERETLRTAMPIPNIIADLQTLSNQYQLVIVSATSDELIREVLDKHRLSGRFSYIFGRDSPLRNWHSIEKKAQNFIKISTMLGIPLERMIFIGDSDADYRAAKQLGLWFIENRFNAGRYGRASLIRELKDQEILHLSSRSGPGDLAAVIRKIDTQLQQ